jgi:hypothetical protein
LDRRLFYAIEAVIGVALLALPLGATASPSGFAWDSVTKIVQNADSASLQPGSFDADYATAAQVQLQSESGGGFMGKIKQAMAMGKNMQQLLQNGFAQKHYLAGFKERTDDIAYQTATIVDCSARTITTLDLHAKTYRVVSMDQPSGSSSSGGGGSSGSSSRPNDDDTKVAIEVTNTALGSLQVAGQPTNGYRSDTTMTETNRSGQSQTQNAKLLGYYTSYAEPELNCSRSTHAPSAPSNPTSGQGFATASRLMQALAGGADPRVTLKQSGPPLPIGKLSMYTAVTFASRGGNGVALVTERGNLRPLDASDPIFSVPSDFTKQQ